MEDKHDGLFAVHQLAVRKTCYFVLVPLDESVDLHPWEIGADVVQSLVVLFVIGKIQGLYLFACIELDVVEDYPLGVD